MARAVIPFMVGPNEYYLTFEKDGFQKATSPEIKVKEKNDVIKLDVGMEKEGYPQPKEAKNSV